MIEIERDYRGVLVGREYKWKWHARQGWAGRPLEGLSREPLLDACRALKRMGASPGELVGVFCEGSRVWSLRTTVGCGAELTVEDGDTGTRFRKYRPHPHAR
jgi:hypothetical protein